MVEKYLIEESYMTANKALVKRLKMTTQTQAFSIHPPVTGLVADS